MTKKTNKKPKRNYLKSEPEVFWYLNAKGEKLWGFRHRYYDDFGKRREKSAQGLTSENIAIRKLLEVKTDLLNGRNEDDYTDITVAEWLDIWYDANKVNWKVRTREQREEAIANKMKPLIGQYKLADLKASTYKRVYINELLKTYAPRTVQLFHQLFKIAVNAAVEDEIIERNRFSKITIEVGEVSENYLSPVELNTFLTAAKRITNITNYTLILLLSYTGLRKGEALGLQWEDIDFNNSTVTVQRTRDRNGSRSPKTLKSYRTIPIDDMLLVQLKRYKTWSKEKSLYFGKNFSEDRFIFISYLSGEPISDNTLTDPFRRIIKETGLKKITPHGLRHTHATILLTKRPVNEVADRLGNTPEMIHRVYGHLMEDMKIESVNAFGESLKMAGFGGEFGGGF